MVWRRLLWPAITTALMLALTTGLGIWQLQRLAWKNRLLAEIDRGEASAPIPLPTHGASFSRVFVDGRYGDIVARYGAEVRATPSGAVMGSHLITALSRPGQLPVIVDRGWAPTDFDAAPPTGTVRVEGYVRPPEYPVRFGAADDPAARRFFALDPVAIGQSMGLTQVAPFTVVALGRPGVLPEPAGAMPRPPNDHLSYAITWFGLSVALLVIFGVYVRQAFKVDAYA